MRIRCEESTTTAVLEEAGMAFMAIVTHHLNHALKDNGIGDALRRKTICGAFLFNLAYELDAGSFVLAGKALLPRLCFAEGIVTKNDDSLGAIATVHVAMDEPAWHELAFGVVSQYFEDDAEALVGLQRGLDDTSR